MVESCALDVAGWGGITLEEVGRLMNITRERVRQVEVHALLIARLGYATEFAIDLQPMPKQEIRHQPRLPKKKKRKATFWIKNYTVCTVLVFDCACCDRTDVEEKDGECDCECGCEDSRLIHGGGMTKLVKLKTDLLDPDYLRILGVVRGKVKVGAYFPKKWIGVVEEGYAEALFLAARRWGAEEAINRAEDTIENCPVILSSSHCEQHSSILIPTWKGELERSTITAALISRMEAWQGRSTNLEDKFDDVIDVTMEEEEDDSTACRDLDQPKTGQRDLELGNGRNLQDHERGKRPG